MIRSFLAQLVVASLPFALANQGFAQDVKDPLESQVDVAGRFGLGALRFTPAIAVSDVGIDSNVFNESQNAKRDFTLRVLPSVTGGAGRGRLRLNFGLTNSLNYYQKYASQRSLDLSGNAKISRITPSMLPWLSARSSRGRERVSSDLALNRTGNPGERMN